MPLSPPEPLAEHHELDSFASGEPALDDWLRRRARANQSSGASRTYVVCEGKRVAGYYALASGAISQVPGRFRRNMPDPIPVVLLARLAVDRSRQGHGLGRALFRDAARRVAQAADTIGILGDRGPRDLRGCSKILPRPRFRSLPCRSYDPGNHGPGSSRRPQPNFIENLTPAAPAAPLVRLAGGHQNDAQSCRPMKITIRTHPNGGIAHPSPQPLAPQLAIIPPCAL